MKRTRLLWTDDPPRFIARFAIHQNLSIKFLYLSLLTAVKLGSSERVFKECGALAQCPQAIRSEGGENDARKNSSRG